MNKLIHLILHVVAIKNWKWIKAGKYSPVISPLMFGDDLMLFGEASEQQMMCVLDTLNNFFRMSEQEISQERPALAFQGMLREVFELVYFTSLGLKKHGILGNI